jgi:hypothetical protein
MGTDSQIYVADHPKNNDATSRIAALVQKLDIELGRLSNIYDRVHGPSPESGSTEPDHQPCLLGHLSNAENMANRIRNMIDAIDEVI